MEERIWEKIREADMLLLGIGEEFEERSLLRAQPEYTACADYLEQQERPDLLPLLAEGIQRDRGRAVAALQRLYRIAGDKNYYLVSTCQTDLPREAGFPEDRVVSPCGTLQKKQCSCGCEQSLMPVEVKERENLYQAVRNGGKLDLLGNCPQCRSRMVLNNIYTEKYDERGYQEDWGRYTRWLQGTLNRKVCILELGVNLDYPSVIRFPFEKMGYYNRKASFIRVNERLYQLTEELHDKGISVAKNAIDWLLTEAI